MPGTGAGEELAKFLHDHGPVLTLNDLITHTVGIIRRRIVKMDDQDAKASFPEPLRLGRGHHRGAHLVGEPVDLVDALTFHAAAGALGVEVYLELGVVHGTDRLD